MKILRVFAGGKAERDKKRNILFNRPWELESDEFERLCELFVLTRSESYDLTAMRVEHLSKTNYEAAAALSIINGDDDFSEIMARGRRKSLTLITSVKPSLPPSA